MHLRNGRVIELTRVTQPAGRAAFRLQITVGETLECENDSHTPPENVLETSTLTRTGAKRYVTENWKDTFACTPTIDESGVFIDTGGQTVGRTFWVTLSDAA